MEKLKNYYTESDAIKALLHERDRWDNDLIDCPDYTDRVLHILRYTKED